MMTLDAFLRHVAGLPAAVSRAERVGLREAAETIADAARAKIGEYQGASGPFPAWRQLAESTQEDRARKGYTPNDPLLRTGEMRASIKTAVGADSAAVGSNSEIAVYQELGTKTIPPRPFLGPAGFENAEKVAHDIGARVARAVAGKG